MTRLDLKGALISSLLATAAISCGDAKDRLGIVTCDDRLAEVPKALTLESNCVRPHTTAVITGKFERWEENIGPHISKIGGLEAALTASNSEALFTSAKVRCTDGTKTPTYVWLLEFPREAFPGLEDDNGALERSSHCSVSETDVGMQATCVPFVRKQAKDDNGKVILDTWSPVFVFDDDTVNQARKCFVKLTGKP